MINPLESEKMASVNVTDDREARPKAWVAALVQTNCERTVANKLENLSIECYVAAQEEMHRWSDRMKKVTRVVIPNIVFIHTDPGRFSDVKRLSFIRGLMAHPGMRQPAAIPEEQMQMLKFMLHQSDVPVYLGGADLQCMSVGERVRVVRGPLKNLEGEICHLSNNELHVGITINELGLAHALVSVNDIEKIK